MTEEFAPEDLIDRISTLTHDRLAYFEHLQIITPVQTADGPRFRMIDLRRIKLLCELTDDFEMNEDALVIVMSLLDQLHGAHGRLDRIVKAISTEPADTRQRLLQHLVDGP